MDSVWDPKLHLITFLQKWGQSCHKTCAVINGCVSMLIVRTPLETRHWNPQLTPSTGRWQLINSKQSYWKTNFIYKSFLRIVETEESRGHLSFWICVPNSIYFMLLQGVRKEMLLAKSKRMLSSTCPSTIVLEWQVGKCRCRRD